MTHKRKQSHRITKIREEGKREAAEQKYGSERIQSEGRAEDEDYRKRGEGGED